MRPEEDLNSEEWKTKFIFMSTQLVFTVVTIIPAYLCYMFYWWSAGAFLPACLPACLPADLGDCAGVPDL